MRVEFADNDRLALLVDQYTTWGTLATQKPGGNNKLRKKKNLEKIQRRKEGKKKDIEIQYGTDVSSFDTTRYT